MRPLLTLVALLAAATLVACGGGDTRPRHVAADELEVVHRWPGRYAHALASAADGTLFVSFDSSLWRGRGRRWKQVSEMIDPGKWVGFQRMYAPSRRTVFITRGPFISRWEQGRGIRDERVPVDTMAVPCGDFGSGERFEAVWGRGPKDVYAVGPHGLIARYDGRRWRMEPNALRARAPSLCMEAFPTDLYAVGGTERETWAAGGSVLRRTRRGWIEVPRPAGEVGQSFLWAMAGAGGEVLMAGHDFRVVRPWPGERYAGFLLRRRGQRWRVVPLGEGGIGEIRGGSGQPGAPAVFWGEAGRVVVVREGRIRFYIVDGVRLRGAVAAGRDVYVVGNAGEGSIVARLPR